MATTHLRTLNALEPKRKDERDLASESVINGNKAT